MRARYTILGAVVAAVSGAVILAPAGAGAAPLTVSSYSMYNGATGAYNYRDFTYLPCPGNACNTTGAPLSGGTGKLTDGVSPALSWYQYGENTPWVGWSTDQANGTDPTVTFNFASSVTVKSVTVWVDNAIGFGGVYLPASVSVDGTDFPIAPDNSNSAPRGYTFNGLDITGTSVDVQFFQTAGYPWVMVGEVSFDGSTVPEPASMALLAAGLAGLGLIRRKRAQ